MVFFCSQVSIKYSTFSKGEEDRLINTVEGNNAVWPNAGFVNATACSAIRYMQYLINLLLSCASCEVSEHALHFT